MGDAKVIGKEKRGYFDRDRRGERAPMSATHRDPGDPERFHVEKPASARTSNVWHPPSKRSNSISCKSHVSV